MKKFILSLLSVSMLMVFSLSSISSADSVSVPSINERVVNILERNNVDFYIEDGNIKLSQVTPHSLNKVNTLLRSQQPQVKDSLSIQARAASYPTAWVHMKMNDVVKDQKFTAATKTAFVVAFTAYARKITTSWQELVAVGVGGFATYYFLNAEKENLYTFIKYSYREVGPGFFTENGTFIGDYELKKDMRVTTNSNGTGGSTGVDIRPSTIIDPWF